MKFIFPEKIEEVKFPELENLHQEWGAFKLDPVDHIDEETGLLLLSRQKVLLVGPSQSQTEDYFVGQLSPSLANMLVDLARRLKLVAENHRVQPLLLHEFL